MYLTMFRPPAREASLDCLEGMWRENADARGPAARILVRWRPDVIKKEEEDAGAVKQEG
jgi:symplekin